MFVFVSGIGGIGNTLFQLATAIYYCETYNYDLIITQNRATLFGTSNLFGKTNCLNVNNEFVTYDKTIFSKIKFIKSIDGNYITVHNNYTNDLIVPTNENILISGYNQNISLFSSVMNKIPKYLHLDDINIKKSIFEKYPNIANSTIICVRIGDDFRHMTKITQDSYLKAIDHLKQNGETINDVFVISDVNTNKFFNNLMINYAEINEPDIIQFYAGLLCKNLILSESTFHLWIAYLASDFGKNTDKKVICFNNTDITNRNLNVENWITLDY